MIYITNKQIEKGFREYQYFLNGRCGHFISLLFEAMAVADNNNMYKLAKVYPELVYAFLDYNGRLFQVDFKIEE